MRDDENLLNPNATQVAGNHYQSSYQHWDFALDILHGRYLEGCITKYMRWRKKNGVEDLRKAVHYIDKLMYEISQAIHRQEVVPHLAPLCGSRKFKPWLKIELFCQANQLGQRESTVVLLVSDWRCTEDLFLAKEILKDMIAEEEERLCDLAAESNSHD